LLLLTPLCCILESKPWSPRLFFSLRFVGLANKITPK
jgi:hypothetical protein